MQYCNIDRRRPTGLFSEHFLPYTTFCESGLFVSVFSSAMVGRICKYSGIAITTSQPIFPGVIPGKVFLVRNVWAFGHLVTGLRRL